MGQKKLNSGVEGARDLEEQWENSVREREECLVGEKYNELKR